jgi:hypothetical protein
MSFEQLTGSTARHSSGYVVDLDHDQLLFEEGEHSLIIPVEALVIPDGFKACVYLKYAQLQQPAPGARAIASPPALADVRSKIAAALTFLKVPHEFVE